LAVKIECRDVLSEAVTLFPGPMCRQGNIPQSCTSGRRPLSPGPISHAPCQRPPALRPRPPPERTTASLRGPTTASTCTAALAMKVIQFFLSFLPAAATTISCGLAESLLHVGSHVQLVQCISYALAEAGSFVLTTSLKPFEPAAGLLSDLRRFDPRSLTWSADLSLPSPSRPSARKGHGFAPAGRSLFASGGRGGEGLADPLLFLSAVHSATCSCG
jgi:hypothetical protein